MKRKDLVKRISKAAKANKADWNVDREGGKHTIYALNEVIIPIPRHNEINEITAQGIMKQCEEVLGKGWWR